ncbi:hypothetical protein ACJJTC_010811 [Scirpophaga incertulas]
MLQRVCEALGSGSETGDTTLLEQLETGLKNILRIQSSFTIIGRKHTAHRHVDQLRRRSARTSLSVSLPTKPSDSNPPEVVPVPSTIPPLTLDPAQSASSLSSSDSENEKSEQTIVSAPVIEALPKTVTPPPPRLIRSCRLKPVSYKY